MNRRDFLHFSALSSVGMALPALTSGSPAQSDSSGRWRMFEVTSRVEVLNPAGVTRVWLPTPLTEDAPYLKALGNAYEAEGGSSGYAVDPKYGAGMVWAEWPEGVKPLLVLKSRFATRDIAVDLSKPGSARPESIATLAKFTKASDLLPTDGIVKATSAQIVGDAATLKRRAASTSGSWTTPIATRRRAAAARAISSSCWRTTPSGANAPT